MKRGTITHHKTADLAARLKIPRYAAVGILESLWHATATNAPAGDVGKLSDKEIAYYVGWDGDEAALVGALTDSRWLDRSDRYRLVIHDWHDHADDTTKKRVARDGLEWASRNVGKCPDTSRQNPPALPSQSLALPEPKPEPIPEDAWPECFSELPNTQRTAQAVGRIIAKHYPPSSGSSGPGVWSSCISRLAIERKEPWPFAAAWLLGRVKAWAASPLCRTTPAQYRPSAAKWCSEDERCYDSPDEDWARERSDGNGKTPTSTTEGIDKAVREIEERHKKLAAQGIGIDGRRIVR